MSSASLEDTRLSLYGPGRNLRFQNIRNNLTKSHVLQDGEYNFTSNKLKRGDIWKTSHSTDFSVSVPSFLPTTEKYKLEGNFDVLRK